MTTGVSRLPPRPRSAMTLEMIPDDDTAVTPGHRQRARRGPSRAPGRRPRLVLLPARGRPPLPPALVRRLVTSCSAEYSSPSVSSSRSTPIWAPVLMNSELAESASTPP